MDIMRWRNEQIYHLRQRKPLTKEDQDSYFTEIVSKLFDASHPPQLLFSYLQRKKCIGYGGLVHINWFDKNAEISFLMATALERKDFQQHWKTYLGLIEQVAFEELDLHKIYTYAFDLRPALYEVLESEGYIREARLREHTVFESGYKDVIIHSKINPHVSIRQILPADKQCTFEWANDALTRKNSFDSKAISFEDHSAWFDSKINDDNSLYFIGEVDKKAASIIRFDLNEERLTTVGITMAPAFRGQRLSSIFIRKGCTEFFKQKSSQQVLYARIKEENTASLQAFQKAGFLYLGSF